jgi:hypothetical protein
MSESTASSFVRTKTLVTTGFFGLCPSFDILETRKHNVSETGPVSVFR